jgi:photosystem II stability/assembly factor-like uncharacterized protein
LDLSSYGTTSVVADPVNSGIVYAGTDKQGIYRSEDCGATWALASTGTDSSTFTSGIAWFLALDPTAPNVIFTASLFGSDSTLLKSTDSGQNWASVWTAATISGGPYTMQWGSIDSGDHTHMVTSFHENCAAPSTPVCFAETHDGGHSWQLANGPPSLKNWEEAAGVYVMDETTFLYLAPFTAIYYTADDGQTWETVAPDGSETVYKATDGYYAGSAQHGIQRSPDGHVWTQIPNSGFAVGPIIGDGQSLYAGGGSKPLLQTSPAADGNAWTGITPPDGMTSGPAMFAYDSGHHLLYSANGPAGLWRMVTH